MRDVTNRETVKRDKESIRAWPAAIRRADSSRYDRKRDLVRLIPLLASDLETPDPASQTRLVALLRRALRQERMRGLAGDWTYDLARHGALLAAFNAEREALRQMASER